MRRCLDWSFSSRIDDGGKVVVTEGPFYFIVRECIVVFLVLVRESWLVVFSSWLARGRRKVQVVNGNV